MRHAKDLWDALTKKHMTWDVRSGEYVVNFFFRHDYE